MMFFFSLRSQPTRDYFVHLIIFVNLLASVPILSQVVKIKMEVQVSNPHGLWLYLSNAYPIIKQ